MLLSSSILQGDVLEPTEQDKFPFLGNKILSYLISSYLILGNHITYYCASAFAKKVCRGREGLGGDWWCLQMWQWVDVLMWVCMCKRYSCFSCLLGHHMYYYKNSIFSFLCILG